MCRWPFHDRQLSRDPQHLLVELLQEVGFAWSVAERCVAGHLATFARGEETARGALWTARIL